MNEANKVKLGAFLLISISLLIVVFVWAGLGKLFAPRYRAMTVLNTSVEGLAISSPVKYLGMPVGKITGMAMRQSDGFIVVYFDIFPSSVESEGGGKPISGRSSDLESVMHRKNLTCFINAAGLMGGAYLELSLSDSLPPAMPHLDIQPPAGVSYIPSRPSHIGNAIQNISRMLDELEKVNFIQLADKLNETLDNLSDTLSKSELRSTLKNINEICSNLEISSRRLQTALSEENVNKLNRAIDNIDAGILGLRKFADNPELGETVRKLNRFLGDAVAAIEKAEAGGKALGGEAAELRLRVEMSLTRLDNTLKQLTEFTQNVSGDPNQFVRGRQEKPVEPAFPAEKR